MVKWLKNAWQENRGFLLFVLLMFVFRSALADWNDVPTGSMKPTIVEGDRILVNKMAYDLRVPFTLISLFKISDPERGDIIVFESDVSGKRLVKRAVGIPGDRVSMRNNVLTINGVKLNYELSAEPDTLEFASDKIENLEGAPHMVRIGDTGSRLSNFPEVIVPEGAYLALGDNRDNSADSRVIGFVPRGEIVGRSRTVVVSLDYENYFIPRAERFLHTL